MYYVLIVFALFGSDVKMPQTFALYSTKEQCEFNLRQLAPALKMEIEKKGGTYGGSCRTIKLMDEDKPA